VFPGFRFKFTGSCRCWLEVTRYLFRLCDSRLIRFCHGWSLAAFSCCKHSSLGCHDLQVGKAMYVSGLSFGAAASHLYRIRKAMQLGRTVWLTLFQAQLVLFCERIQAPDMS